MQRSVLLLCRKTPSLPRPSPAKGLPDGAQWVLTIGLATMIPGLALYKCFHSTGAVEAEIGVQKELARSRRLRAEAAAAAEASNSDRSEPQSDSSRSRATV
eukprot:TRINITY_DN94509_c0_g1_i1.p1 TRINITY_DN94509_c0_g1~~TRINITY_DN94509_c0_g1_i1.p1  ORF type:complete len:101 (-),score=20.44 TRINITY_DN94509_c0_g1_i1:26-328(-)